MPLDILLVSVHPVLEYDEIQLFEALGHRVFSLGFYFHRAADTIRPPLADTPWHQDIRRAFHGGFPLFHKTGHWFVTPAFASAFDVVVIHHPSSFLRLNWERLRGKPTVLRMIGQEAAATEAALQPYRADGLHIVRWSPVQVELEHYVGGDVVIRTAKDVNDWRGWEGGTPRILTFANDAPSRGGSVSLDFWRACVEGLPADLYGLRNDGIAQWRGVADYDYQRALLRAADVVFVTGTRPAPYTLSFVEAWLTGAPVVHIGAGPEGLPPPGTYEMSSLIENGVTGFVVDSVEDARAAFALLLRDRAKAQRISQAGRERAISLFGRDRNAALWDDFLQRIVG